MSSAWIGRAGTNRGNALTELGQKALGLGEVMAAVAADASQLGQVGNLCWVSGQASRMLSEMKQSYLNQSVGGKMSKANGNIFRLT